MSLQNFKYFTYFSSIQSYLRLLENKFVLNINLDSNLFVFFIALQYMIYPESETLKLFFLINNGKTIIVSNNLTEYLPNLIHLFLRLL